MSDDKPKPTGYATLREVLAVIIEHEAARASSPEFGSGKAVPVGIGGFRAPEKAAGALIGCILVPRWWYPYMIKEPCGPSKPPDLLGSPGRIRTSDQPVNSRLLYH